jgi:hypothetical protein
MQRARSLATPRVAAKRGRASTLFFLLSALAMPACGGSEPDDGGGAGGAPGRGGAGGVAGSGTSGAAGVDAGSGGAAGHAGRGGAGATGGSGATGGAGGAGAGGAGGTAGSGAGGSAGKGGNGGGSGASGTGGSADSGAPDAGRDGSAGSGGMDGGSDGRIADSAIDGAGGAEGGIEGGACAPIDPKDSTIEAYQTDIVSRLAGQTEIATGVKLVNRATAGNRQVAREYMKKLFQDLALTPLEQNYGTGTNVYATLPSTSGGAQSVVFGAHFDSVAASPGANDNATGVAAVFAAARYAVKLPCRSKAIIFALFDEEEVGLVGSKQFATKLKNDGTMIHSVHTIDQMGWDSDNNRMIELELPDTGLRELYEAAATKLGVNIPMVTTKTASTDHSSFRPTFLAIGLTEGYTQGDTTPHYHKAGDVFGTVNFPYLASTTVLVNQMLADVTR